jgi:hypothetical protein
MARSRSPVQTEADTIVKKELYQEYEAEVGFNQLSKEAIVQKYPAISNLTRQKAALFRLVRSLLNLEI